MIEDGLAQRHPEAPKYTKPYSPEFDQTPLPRNYRLPEFILFSRDGQTSSIEHIGRFTAQCVEADSDAQRLRLFVHSDRRNVIMVHKPSTEFGEGLV